jgi:DNA-binding transcriptional MerR regulator
MLESTKSSQAFRTISEVSDDLGVPQHVLRFWETKFSAIRPLKRGGNRRYYRPEDIQLLRGINKLLYTDGYTIRGVQKLIREQGARDIAALHGGQLPGDDAGESNADGVRDAETVEPVLPLSTGQPAPLISAPVISAPGNSAPIVSAPIINAPIINAPGVAVPTMEFEPLADAGQPVPYLPVPEHVAPEAVPVPVKADVSDAIARLQMVRSQIESALGQPA